ncbi:MAG: hypothetical protein CSA18_03680 [Deltaproteobacteria bacterium]|nr:MAG: hypothetical protein CSA18_03680 [Deltaproteobacteria bacterium]
MKTNNYTSIFLSILIASIPVFYFIDPLISCLISISFIYNILILKKKVKPPKTKNLFWMTIFFTIILGLNFRNIFSRSAGVPLLIIMSNLKLMEIKNNRDELFSCFMSFFILLSLILFSSSFFSAVYMLCSAVFTISVMIQINSPEKNFKKHLKKSLYFSIPALFSAFILFFFFPRIEINLWGKKDSSKNISGFSENLNPGSVSSLAKDNTEAFKIQSEEYNFKEDSYFRGIVFTHFNGFSWKPDKRPEQNINFKPDKSQKALIILAPTNSKYLISPEYPVKSSETNFYLTKNFILYSSFSRIRKKTRYEIIFSKKLPKAQFPDEKYLNLPPGFNPRSIKFVKNIEKLSPEEKVSKILDFFKNNNFVYTLNPPKYSKDYIDEFLFDKKKGFCEHYASAFAFLMRAANIPSRIVGGYLGGEKNTIGNFLQVRQSNAHAWCEIYLKNRGWIKIDPTMEVSPERLDSPIERLSDTDKTINFNSLSRFISPISKIISALDFFWNQKIAGFDHQLQELMFSFLGLNNLNLFKKVFFFILIIILMIFIGNTAIFIKKFFREKEDREIILFKKFQKKIKLEKKEYEGFEEYMERINKSGLNKLEDIRNFINLFIRARYNGENDNKTIRELEKIIRKI